MAGSTRWECIKNNLPGNKQTWSSTALPGCLAGSCSRELAAAVSKIHTWSENRHHERLRPPVLNPGGIAGFACREPQIPRWPLPFRAALRAGHVHSCKALWDTAPEVILRHTLGQPGDGTSWFGKCWLTAKPQGCVCGQLHALAPDRFCAAATPSKPTWGHLGSFVVLIHIKTKKKK